MFLHSLQQHFFIDSIIKLGSLDGYVMIYVAFIYGIAGYNKNAEILKKITL